MATPLLTTAYVADIILRSKNKIATLTDQADDRIRQGEPYDKIFNVIQVLRAGVRSLSDYNVLTDLEKQKIISCMIKKGDLFSVQSQAINPISVTYVSINGQTTVEEALNDAGVEDVPQAIVEVTLDPTITTRFNYLVRLKQAFITWLITRLLPAGGTTGQGLVKTANNDYAVDWATAAPDYLTTSTSSNTVGSGTKVFSIADANVAYYLGLRIRAYKSSDEGVFLEGTIIFISGTTIVINADVTRGSGTVTSWILNLPGLDGYKILIGVTKTVALGSFTFSAMNLYGAYHFSKGTRIRATDTSDSTRWVEGPVTAYDGTDLTLNVDTKSGSGSVVSWEINIGNNGLPTAAVGYLYNDGTSLSYSTATIYQALSTSSLATAKGSRSFTIDRVTAYTVGTRIRFTSAGTGDYMEGNVTSYNTGTGVLVVLVDTVKGTGTNADWACNIGGAAKYLAFSTSSVTVGTGSKTFAVGTGYAFAIGNRIRVADASDPTNFLEGDVTAYSNSTGDLTILVDRTGGSGTLVNWNINLGSFVSGAVTVGTWINATLQHGWTTTAFYDLAYRKDSLGNVYLKGIASGGLSTTSVLMTLPAGYRPTTTTLTFIVPNIANYGTLLIHSDGTVELEFVNNGVYTPGGTATLYLDGVRFNIDQ
jgi:hypothetical protein